MTNDDSDVTFSTSSSDDDESSSRPDSRTPLEAGLFLVATPIGNLEDITLRALRILQSVDAIACEDTRVTQRLLKRYGISKPLLSYHDHNAEKMRPILTDKIKIGQSVALVSDAGTPLVSDPGYRLVQDCLENSLHVTAIPGPSAPVTALILSGLPTDCFLFAGFVPPKPGARTAFLKRWAEVDATLIFFETGPRLSDSLAAMKDVLGARTAAVTRELTKMFEEARRGMLDDLCAHYTLNGPPKGEIVVVVGPPASDTASYDAAAVEALLKEAMTTRSTKDAVVYVCAQTGFSRKSVYQQALTLLSSSNS